MAERKGGEQEWGNWAGTCKISWIGKLRVSVGPVVLEIRHVSFNRLMNFFCSPTVCLRGHAGPALVLYRDLNLKVGINWCKPSDFVGEPHIVIATIFFFFCSLSFLFFYLGGLAREIACKWGDCRISYLYKYYSFHMNTFASSSPLLLAVLWSFLFSQHDWKLHS